MPPRTASALPGLAPYTPNTAVKNTVETRDYLMPINTDYNLRLCSKRRAVVTKPEKILTPQGIDAAFVLKGRLQTGRPLGSA